MPPSELPTPNGEIVFSEKFGQRPDAEQIGYLKKLCSSQNEALDMMQKERNALAEANKLLQTNLVNAQVAFDTQKQIVSDLITQNNEEKQGIAKRIQELESRVKAQDKTIKVLNGGID